MELFKRRIKELGLMDVESGVYRSKVDCLRVCRQGPIMVSYPDGTWYHSCTSEVLGKNSSTACNTGQACQRVYLC